MIARANALSTPYGADDLAVLVPAGPDAILIPKVDGGDEVVAIGQRMDALGAPPAMGLWVMIETPRAIIDIAGIAAARRRKGGERLAGFVMGTNDLAKETRARLAPGRAAFLPMLVAALLAARAEGLDVVDGVYNAIKDAEGFAAECAQGRDLGFDGKTLIHPDQIAVANAAFGPTGDEVAWARRVIAAFDAPEARGLGALQVEGRMVERLHAEMAQRTVALADAIAAAGG